MIMKINKLNSNEAILSEFGKRISRQRIDMGLTQAVLANQAGLSKSTVERIESGSSAQLSSVIRVLRVLDLLGSLNTIIPESSVSPMELLRLKGKQRQRASNKKPDAANKDWQWGDE